MPAVEEELVRLKMVFPLEHMETIWQEMVATNTKIKEQAATRTFDEGWLNGLGILEMFSYRFQVPFNNPEDPATTLSIAGCEGALKIVEDLPLRRSIIPMAFAGIHVDDIGLICNGRYSISYDSEDFKIYVDYFANFESWSPNDKSLYTAALPPDESQLKNHLTIAGKNDKNYLLWKLGITPDKPMDAMFREMMADCFYNFKDKQKINPDDAGKWGTLAVRIADRLEKVDNENKNNRDIFSQLKFKLVLDDDAAVDTSDISDGGDVPMKASAKSVDAEDGIINIEDLQ